MQTGDEAFVRPGSYSEALVYNRPLTAWITVRCEPAAVLTNTLTGTSVSLTLAWDTRTLCVESVCGSQASSRPTLRVQATWIVT